jgi:preprotein translocase subunit SecB
VNLETNVALVGNEHYEVVLSVSIKSTIESATIFIMELKYAGLLSLKSDIGEELKATILLVHCPFLLFPFARAIIADMTRAGGYQQILLEPVDFAALYLEKQQRGTAASTRIDDGTGYWDAGN